MEGPEAEPNHESSGNGHGRAKPGGALDECTEAERHQQHLKTPVWSDARDRFLHGLELPCFNRDVIKKNCGEHDPGYLQQTEGNTVLEAHGRKRHRHSKKHDRHGRRRECSGNRAQVGFHLETGEQSEEDKNRQRRNQGRKPPMTERVIDLSPMHDLSPRPSANNAHKNPTSEVVKARGIAM